MRAKVFGTRLLVNKHALLKDVAFALDIREAISDTSTNHVCNHCPMHTRQFVEVTWKCSEDILEIHFQKLCRGKGGARV